MDQYKARGTETKNGGTTMKAPEKIYIDVSLDSAWGMSKRSYDNEVEYTRTDAFIEKACEWLKENFLFDEAGYCKTNIYSTKNMIYNFKNTLGGKL